MTILTSLDGQTGLPRYFGPVFEQARQMRGVFADVPGVIAASMARDLGHPVDHADRRRARDQAQRSPHVGVGNRVEIPVEPDVGRLAGADRAQQVGGEGMGGQRQ